MDSPRKVWNLKAENLGNWQGTEHRSRLGGRRGMLVYTSAEDGCLYRFLPPELTSGFLRVISMLAAGPKPVRDLMWICVGRGRLHWQYTENAMDFKY